MKKALDRINGDFYKGASARGRSPPTRRLIMTLTDQIRNDMAAKGYVYYRETKNYLPQAGFRKQCRNVKGEDYSKLIFDTDAYKAHGHSSKS